VVAFGREFLPTTDYAGEIYMRQERMGALMGTTSRIAAFGLRMPRRGTSACSFPDDLTAWRAAEIGFRHFPIGAPESRKSLTALHVCAGRQSACRAGAGLAQLLVCLRRDGRIRARGGVGLALSRWMAEGDPGADLFAMDVARYGAFATPAYTNVRRRRTTGGAFESRFPTRSARGSSVATHASL
jgi:dimethylglycine dehydrogenase